MALVRSVLKMLAIWAFMAGIPTVRAGDAVGADAGTPFYSRPLAFTTDEVTWTALDLSPDGRTILFDVLGDLYTLDSVGGKAKPLLLGPAFERQAVFSPDGKRIAFISDRDGSNNLWIANADGSGLKRLSHDDGAMIFSAPAWSADGKSVYVSKAHYSLLAFEVFMFDTAGGSGIKITKAQPSDSESFDDRTNVLGVVASPDGQYLYYASKLGTTWTSRKQPHWSVVRHDLHTGVKDKVIPSNGNAMAPALSHDGQKIAYATREGNRTGLRLRNLVTGEDTRLVFPVDNAGISGGYYAGLVPRFVFTPDDRALILSVGGGLAKFSLADGVLEDIPFTVDVNMKLGALTRIQQDVETGPVKARIIQDPKVSPDGNAIAFSALGQIYVMELAHGAKPRKITSVTGDQGAFQPAWTPDGRSLVYVTWSPTEGGHVWTVPIQGGDRPRRLTSAAAYYTEPVVSPDGETMVFLRSSHYDRLRTFTEIWDKYATDIVRLPLKGDGGPEELVAHAFGARGLHFTQRADTVFFQGQAGLSSVRLEGEAPQTLLSVTARNWSQYAVNPVAAEDIRVRPQGDLVLAKAASSQLFMFRMPPGNGEVPTLLLENAQTGSRQLTDIGADFLDWSADGKTFIWSIGASLYRMDLEHLDLSDDSAQGDEVERFEVVVEVPRDVPEGALLLRGATAITMKGDEVIDNADIVVVNDRISAVGPRGTLVVPEGADIIDATGSYIVPGFVDTHAHWFSIRRRIVEKYHWNFLANLAYGVTSGLDVQTFTNDTFVYQDMIDAGMFPGPRAFSTGPGIFVNSDIHSRPDAVAVLTRYRDHYRTRNLKAYMVGDRQQRRFLLQAARSLGMMPTTEGASDLHLNLTHALDGFAGNEHNLPVAPLHKDIVTLFAKSRTAYTPTLSILYGGPLALSDAIIRYDPLNDAKLNRFTPRYVLESAFSHQQWTRSADQTYPLFAASAIAIQRAGGLVGVGSHGEVQGLGYHWEMEALAAGGASPHEVLMAATIGSAEVIGRKSQLGSLEVGKYADLVILTENPLEEIRNTKSIHQVMKNGRLYDGESLAEIWPRKRQALTSWFNR